MTTKSTSTALGTAVDLARHYHSLIQSYEGNSRVVTECFYFAAMSSVINHLAK